MKYVISDIHGCFETFLKMLKIINFSDNDILYILGDVVDRGKESIRILKDMMVRPNVFGIVGNHDLMAVECLEWLNAEITNEMIDELEEEKIYKLADWIGNGGTMTIQGFKKLAKDEKQDVIDYLKEWTLYEEVEVNDKR